MSQPRIPPRPPSDWDDEVRAARSVLRPPAYARSAPKPQEDTAPREAVARQEQQKQAKRPESNILGIFSWHPELTKAFFVFNNHLFHSTLTDWARELVTVRVSWLRRGEYEWAQHVRMARNVGMSQEEIDAISVGPDSPVWGTLDAALLRAADQIVADRYIDDKTWNELAAELGREQLMDLVFTIGAYDLLAMAFNNFGLRLDSGMSGFPADTEI